MQAMRCAPGPCRRGTLPVLVRLLGALPAVLAAGPAHAGSCATPRSGAGGPGLLKPPPAALLPPLWDLPQKYSGKEQLLATLREVALGEFRIPGNAARRLSRAVRAPLTDAGSQLLETLTNREREILRLFVEGLTYQEIGEIRNNSGLTVRNAVSGIQRKLGFKTRQQLVLWAVRIGLVDVGGESSSNEAPY